ncbi:MAG: hypothetical protein JSU70_10745 [Phycisphaerales bacterium]|nr:MAG: hypothetical protein JSU70_10745 [Phycisphaerales bacterium]
MRETKADAHKKRSKISPLTNLALALTAVGAASILSLHYAEGLALIGLLLFMPLALVVTIIGLVNIRTSERKTMQLVLIIAALVVQVGLSAPLGYHVSSERILQRIGCGCDPKALGMALSAYANDHSGRYPNPQDWCDALAEHSGWQGKLFCKHPSAAVSQGLCHYALNPECEPGSPGDVVLIFETRGGWNQSGGPESLTAKDNYKRGWRVLLNNGHLKFIEPRGLAKLKWQVP